MQQGKTITELAQEVERRTAAANDYVASTQDMQMQIIGDEENTKLALNLNDTAYFDINENAHNQIAGRMGIPARYYNRMVDEAPELLLNNVNHWFENGNSRKMLRTLDGTARAFLSERYRRIDNDQILESSLKAIGENVHAVPLASEVTDNRLYLKVLFPNISAEIKTGDVIHPAALITNSEVGLGSLNVQAFFFRSYCTNGCTFGSSDTFGMSRRHVGGKVIEGTDYQVLQDDTLKAQDEALMLGVRDTIAAASSQKFFDTIVSDLRNAADSTTMVNPEKGIELLAKEMGLSQTEKQAALINLIEDRDYSQYGALNAVTKIANTTDSFDRIHDLESTGNKILQLAPAAWEKIAVAA